jgi:YbbR domain-containing protein
LYEHLSPTTQLLSFYPENIAIYYYPLKVKELPVILDSALSLASGYVFVDSATINPSTVVVYGNAQALDTLQAIRTEQVKKKNISKQVDAYLDLQIPQGIRTSTEKVKLTVNVEAYTEKSFEIPIVSNHLPENLYIRFFPSTVTLICRIPLSKYAQLTEKELEVSIDYNDLKRNKDTMLPLQLSKKPKELINYRLLPDRVEYLIEQKGHL